MLVCSPAEDYYACRKTAGMGEKPFRSSELRLVKIFARANAAMGERYIALSQYLAEVVRNHHSLAPIDVVPVYGVDTTVFAPAAEPRSAIKSRLGLPSSGSLIFFSSRVAPEKDSFTLLSAISRLRGRGRDVWLLHRSGGYKTLAELGSKLGIASRIIATDAVHPHHQLPADYQASDLCVQASRAEGLGFSPLEALACGVPVVASSVGGLKETIIDQCTGWTYPAGDSEALAEAIDAGLNDGTEAARRAHEGRKMVQARYERKFVFDQIETLVASVLSRTKRNTQAVGAGVPANPAGGRDTAAPETNSVAQSNSGGP
jgi:glycosyltransferase involved in cell wall biosynthesis